MYPGSERRVGPSIFTENSPHRDPAQQEAAVHQFTALWSRAILDAHLEYWTAREPAGAQAGCDGGIRALNDDAQMGVATLPGTQDGFECSVPLGRIAPQAQGAFGERLKLRGEVRIG